VPNPIGIKRYSIPALEELITEMGEPRFRATQLLSWLYAKGAQSYQEMSNLPSRLRAELEAQEPLALPHLAKRQLSADGTRKYLLRLADGSYVESIGIPHKDRLTVCFSTQVGCAMGCTFCATGTRGLVRSLHPGEMVDQLVTVSRDFGARVTNAVAMGEGEPFANYEATLAALRIMNAAEGLGIGARHLTVSSCGLLRPLRRFAREPEQFTLAISLHSAVQTTRDALMPALANQPLDRLCSELASYVESTGRRPTLEFALIANVNDTDREVAALIAFAQQLLCHVNLIPLNPSGASAPALQSPARDGAGLLPSRPERCAAIAERLQKAGIECSVRRARGLDISGACGQLKGQVAQEGA
jgi:23S rRNA (adenine2503-C2)-methyltransferase